MNVLPETAKTWTTQDRAGWPSGPWDAEPDKVSWTDPATGRPCLIHRGPSGALCGYVAVDPGHPLHGEGYDSVDVSVHGGLTYAGPCDEAGDESTGICHVPEPGAPDDVWWFGFDTAHAGDVSPAHLRHGLPFRGDTYRHLGYVAREVESLAAQLAERP